MELKDVLMSLFGMNPKHYYNITEEFGHEVIAERIRIDVYWNNCTLCVALFYKNGERDINDKDILKLLMNGDAWASEVE